MAHRPSPRRLRYRVGSKHQSQLSRRLRLAFARIATHLRPPGPLAVIRASFPSSDSVVCDTQERAAGSARTWALDIEYRPPPRAGPRRPRACLDRRRSAELGRSRVPTPVVYKRFFVFNTDRPARPGPPARESESATRSPARVRRGVRETRYRFRLPRYRNGTPPDASPESVDRCPMCDDTRSDTR